MSSATRLPPHTRLRRYALPNTVRDRALGALGGYLLTYLLDSADFRTWTWTGSKTDLAYHAGIGRKSVDTALKKLELARLVTIVKPFKQYGEGVIRVDCYADLVVTSKKLSDLTNLREVPPRAERPAASSIAPPIASSIAPNGTSISTPTRDSFPKRATEEKVSRDQRVERPSDQLLEELEQGENDATPKTDGSTLPVDGSMLCPDCGGWLGRPPIPDSVEFCGCNF